MNTLEQICTEGKAKLEALLSHGLPYDTVITGEFYVIPKKETEYILEAYFKNKRYKAEKTQKKVNEVEICVFAVSRINLKELDELLDNQEVHGFFHYLRTWDELGRALPGYKRGDWKRHLKAIREAEKKGLYIN